VNSFGERLRKTHGFSSLSLSLSLSLSHNFLLVKQNISKSIKYNKSNKIYLMDAMPLRDSIEEYIYLRLDTTNFTRVSNYKVN
jgi:hypothetical protein